MGCAEGQKTTGIRDVLEAGEQGVWVGGGGLGDYQQQQADIHVVM